nr:transposase [Streptomyces sp. TRM70350]
MSFQRPDQRAEEPGDPGPGESRGRRGALADRGGIRSDQVTGRSWGAKGCTPVVRRTGNRFSVNATSAISTKGRMHFMVFTETFDADVMCRFLDRLAGHFDREVHLVVDGHFAHASNCTSCRRTRRS